MSDAVLQFLDNRGIEYATVEDAAEAAMRIITDPKVVGRAFAILPRSLAPRGYRDIDIDDYEEGSFLGQMQALAGGSSHRTQVSSTRKTLDASVVTAGPIPDMIPGGSGGSEDSHSMVMNSSAEG